MEQILNERCAPFFNIYDILGVNQSVVHRAGTTDGKGMMIGTGTTVSTRMAGRIAGGTGTADPEPTEIHFRLMTFTHHALRKYEMGTEEYGLWYPKGNDLVIQAYTVVDWGRSVDDCKSTSGEAFYLGGCLVSWLSKKQSSVSLSTAEAKYVTAATCCTQGLWMKQTLQDLQFKFDEPIPIFCDNTSAISISKNLLMHSKTKHILIKYHFVREQVAKTNIKLEYLGTKEQIVDIFTKPLPCEAF
eukprot:PITA_06164